MNRRVSPVAAPTSRAVERREAVSGWRRARRRAVEALLVVLLLGLLSGAGARLVIPPSLFDRAIQALEASASSLVRYELGAGLQLPVTRPGFLGLEEAAGRVWSAAGLDGRRPEAVADGREGLLHLIWSSGNQAEEWRVVALREDGASSAFVWLRAAGVSPQDLRQQSSRLLQAARRLSSPSPGYLYVRLEGFYGEPMGPSAREALARSVARAAGEDAVLSVDVASLPGGTRLVIETAGPARADLPLPTYSQAR